MREEGLNESQALSDLVTANEPNDLRGVALGGSPDAHSESTLWIFFIYYNMRFSSRFVVLQKQY